MFSDNVLAAVQNYFVSNYMNAVDEWLEGCVDYLKELHGNDVVKIQEEAKQQWLLNDLEEVCSGCLPSGLATQHKTILNGVYLLQIKSIRDIGTPAYQQYLELQKVNMENIEATTRYEDKIPSRRMFKLQLTDGEQEISAIEYEHIRSLNSDIPIQSKVFIKGPVTCRRGCLLLTEPCIQLLHNNVPQIQTLQGIGESTVAVDSNIQNTGVPAIETSSDQEIQRTSSVAPMLDQHDEWLQDNMDHLDVAEVERAAHTKRSLALPDHHPDKRARLEYLSDDDAFMLEDDEHLRDLEAQLDGTESGRGRGGAEVPREPYVYLKQLVELGESARAGRSFTVKAVVARLCGKLAVRGARWSLRCVLADGTACLPAAFDSDVFSRLIGLTPHRMNQLKKDMITRPKLKQEAVQALQKAKEALQVLCCAVEVSFGAEPTITRLAPFDRERAQLLVRRYSAF